MVDFTWQSIHTTTIARGVARGKDHRLLLFADVALDLLGTRTFHGNCAHSRRRHQSETGRLWPHFSGFRWIAGCEAPCAAPSLSPGRAPALARLSWGAAEYPTQILSLRQPSGSTDHYCGRRYGYSAAAGSRLVSRMLNRRKKHG